MAAFVFTDADRGADAFAPGAAGIAACLRRTFGPRVIPAEVGASLLRLNPGGVFGRPLRDPVLAPSAHMAGAWLRSALEAGQGRTAGAVLVADCVNDLVCSGASPLFFMMCAGAGGAAPGTVQDMADGAAEACRAADCAFVGVDARERDAQTGASGFAVGVVERQRRLDSRAGAHAGDAILGVVAEGLNGVERCALERLLPGAWQNSEPMAELGCTLAQALAAPPRVLSRALGALFRAYRRKRVPTGAAVVGEGGVPGA
ncbi:MAG TPA: AIR synthase related protein, partial [Candidatus Brocadiia bacterium]|nr:AIR synthase related protein [Candidatus Brocadiia bacterium]